MTRSKRLANLIAVVLGFAAFVIAVVLLWNRWVSSRDLVILVGMYIPAALGITVGYHRLLAHRSFDTFRPVRHFLTVLGTMAVQGPVLEWVSDHRKHHAHADRDGDPHSPHVGHGSAWLGFWHSHMGWVFRTQGEASRHVYARDLLEDRGIVFIDRAGGLFVLLSFAIPFALGYAGGSLRDGLTGLFWGGFARVALMHHASFSVNSICHMFGRRPFKISDSSGNVFWLAVPTLGESWHHNHHAFPASAFHGLRWWQLDVSAWVIRLMRAVGLAWDVVDVSLDQQRRRLAVRAEQRA
jgi:stearoyl-CoA desaturase (delta-9 desaturase)